MRIILLLVAASLPAWAGNWDQVLTRGWTHPKSYFMYGYSEFTPSYLAGVRPYETYLDSRETLLKGLAFQDFVERSNGHRFAVSRYEELRHIQPGLEYVARHWLEDLRQLVAGDTPGGDTLRGIPKLVTQGNVYWPEALERKSSRKIVTLTPLVMSRTQEDLGRTHPWLIYGGSEIDWEEIFWKHSQPADPAAWWCRLLGNAFAESGPCDLKRMGVGILTSHADWLPPSLRTSEVKLESGRELKYLVTFEPYANWGEKWQQAYLRGKLQVIPHPSSLIFSRSPFFDSLAEQSPEEEAKQLPLAVEFSQFARGLAAKSFYGIKAFDVSRRKHRFQRDGQNEAARPIWEAENPFALIFEPDPRVMGIYGKPIARNVQVWGVSGPLSGQWLMHGPSADRDQIDRVRARLQEDQGRSRIHYRNYFPPMEINGYAARWYRPLVAYTESGSSKIVIDTELLGSVRLSRGREEAHWFPVIVRDAGAEQELAKLSDAGGNPETTSLNAQKIVEFSKLMAGKITEDVASALLNPVKPSHETYAKWRETLPDAIGSIVDKAVDSTTVLPPLRPLTYASTVNDRFEHDYWKKIVELTEGTYHVHKNNTDCAATDSDPHGRDPHCSKNQLPEVLGYLRRYYDQLKLPVHVQTFDWKTDFDFPFDGIKEKQHNLIVVIHGKDGKPHDEAIIMADHYDTAHMGDIYEGEIYAEKRKDRSLIGHRHASKGSDDNHSATAALMEAARVLKDLPLKKDVWLVHITGEEFPADGLGSRALCQALIEGRPLVGGTKNPRIAGVYILDMVAHSTDRDHAPQEPAPAVFQIAPGRGERAAKLAVHAHQATRAWNRLKVEESWDAKFGRRNYWKRFKTPKQTPVESFPLPVLGKFLTLRGEIRPGWHFRSSLYNTDIQLFTDAGFPAVLFMENYDINRQGYHDTLDNLDNIDLDYGRGVVSVAIETVAQAASH